MLWNISGLIALELKDVIGNHHIIKLFCNYNYYFTRFLRDNKRALRDQVQSAALRGGAGEAAGDVPDRAPRALEPRVRRRQGQYSYLFVDTKYIVIRYYL